MTFVLDAHQIGRGETGNETWARNIVRALERDGGAPIHYAVSAAGRAHTDVPAHRLHNVTNRSAGRLVYGLPRLLRQLDARAVVSQYTLPISRTPGVVVVHDVSFMLSEAKDWIPPRTLLRYRASIGGSIRRARAVVVPTEFTKGQLLACFARDEGSVFVAPLALDEALPLHRRDLIAREHSVVLCVGTLLPRKNIPVVARAVAVLRREGRDVRLRLVGPVRPAGVRDLAVMRSLLGDALEVVGSVTAADLALAYTDSDVLAYPSLHEGFGLPLLEAMALGTPVVSSTATCLPEVAGGAAIMVEPEDVAGWTAALSLALSEPSRWIALGRSRARDFTWDLTALRVREALDLAT